MINDSLTVTGQVNVKVFNSNGELKTELNKSNLVVSVGKNFIASRIASNTATPMNHMAIGYGTNPAALANTSLQDEAQNGRIAIAQPTITNNVMTFIGVFGPTYGTGSISEAGIFNSNSGGLMMCRTSFPPVQKDNEDTVAISWTITIS